MRLAYITAQVPWGRGETFIIDEMLAVRELGAELLIIPRNPSKEVFHQEAQALLENAVRLPLINFRMISIFLFSLLVRLRLWKVLASIFRYSRTWRILAKNLVVAPKGAFVASLLTVREVEHIHAHWGSTTATMAWVISELTGIPWSFTLHRWDIAENNLLKVKIERAAFTRCIAEDGRREVLNIVGMAYQEKVKVLHLGVRIPETLPQQSKRSRSELVIACPANLVSVKGHRFLVEACALLAEQGIRNFQCLIMGDGPLEEEIRKQIAQLGLEEVVKLVGRIPHESLLHMYEQGEVDTVALPSIVTADGEKEGIPVALMEAMAYKIPVISTNTGGIPELLSDGAGLMVEEKDSVQLADAIEKLIKDSRLAAEIGQKGYERVKDQFDLYKNVAQLLELMKQYKSSTA